MKTPKTWNELLDAGYVSELTDEQVETAKVKLNEVTPKKYKCDACGFENIQSTNHYGPTWSFDRFNVCPKCPPYKKFSEYGGQTTWTCIETNETKGE